MKTRTATPMRFVATFFLLVACVAGAAVLFASCTPRIGWGVVLWSIKGTTAKAGDIVPVYLMSNITKVYVIGLEGEEGGKLEVPLWQIEMFKSKGSAKARVEKFGNLMSSYLIAARDGLPVRETPTNIAKRVYRLRENESVKALEKVEGEALYTGETKLQGDWYRVLAMDGTTGYVFSYAMKVYDENEGAAPVQQSETTNQKTVDAVFSKTWRPAWYATMLDDETVDIDYFSLRFGLFGDAINRQIRVELPTISKVFQYSSITQDKDWIVFGSTDLRIKQENESSLLVSWNPAGGEAVLAVPDDSAGFKAGETLVRFVQVAKDVREAIRNEESRRSDSLREFFAGAARAAGGAVGSGAIILESNESGRLELWPSGLYSWSETQNLPAGFAPRVEESITTQKGTIVFGLRLAPELLGTWQGGFSLYPDSTGRRSDYLYRFTAKEFIIAKPEPTVPGGHVVEVDKRSGTAVFVLSGAR